MNITEAEVVARVGCPRCLAVPGRECRATGARNREHSQTHEARWRKLEREVRRAVRAAAQERRAA